jgi:hypothetical protein
MGPILDEFRREKASLSGKLRDIRRQAMTALGRDHQTGDPAEARVTVQGGIGDDHEDRLLRDYYQVDGTGWGSAFLFVPEVVNIDPESLRRLERAGEEDIHLSDASPLGVPFWTLRDSASEQQRRQRIADGKPGSRCPKGYLVSSTEFTTAPICTASRAFQRRKLEQIATSALSALDQRRAREEVVAKACICHDLAGGATGPSGIDPAATTAVCCGPNAAYFLTETTLDGLVDHIYGRAELPLRPGRPHMLLKELSLHLHGLRQDIDRHHEAPTESGARAIAACRDNLLQGIQHYRDLAAKIVAHRRDAFLARLEILHGELAELTNALTVRG